MRNILVSRWLKLSSVLAFIACIGVHFTIRKYSADYADWFSVTSARFECRVAYGISIVWDSHFTQRIATHVRG